MPVAAAEVIWTQMRTLIQLGSQSPNGDRTLAIGPNRAPQPHFGYIPFEDTTRSLLDGKPAHIRAAYSIAAPVAVERENIKAFWAVGYTDRVAESDCRYREMSYRRDASFDPVTGSFLSSHRHGFEWRQRKYSVRK